MTLSVQSKDLGNGQAELTVTVSADQIDEAIRLVNMQMAKRHGIVAGPDELAMAIITKVGLARYQAALDTQVTDYLAPFAVTQAGLPTIMDPQVRAGSTGVSPGQGYTFGVTLTIKPQYGLSSYGPVSLEVPAPAVTAAEIDEQLQLLAADYAVWEKDEDRPLVLGDFILMNIRTVDYTGTEIPFLTAESMQYALGRQFLPGGFDGQLVGMEVGEEKRFTVDLPDLAADLDGDDWDEWEDWEGWALDTPGAASAASAPDAPDAASAPDTPGAADADRGHNPERSTRVSVTVEVLERQKRIVPEVNDLWAKQTFADCSSLLDLREKVRAAGLVERQNEVRKQISFAAAAELAKRLTGQIPDQIVEYTRGSLLKQIEANLLAQGRTLDDLIEHEGGGQEQFDRQLIEQVREMLAQGFSLDALARHLGMSVSPEDIDEAFRQIAPGQEKRMRQDFEATGRMYLIYDDALRNKANQWLVETATIAYLDAEGRIVDPLAN